MGYYLKMSQAEKVTQHIIYVDVYKEPTNRILYRNVN